MRDFSWLNLRTSMVYGQKVVDAWLVETEDYLHATKVGRHSAVEFAQSYLKGYASTWWRTMRQEEGKNHGYTWNELGIL
jgi:hypothetical protein